MKVSKLLVAAVSCTAASFGFSQTLFTDDFTAGNTNGWISSSTGNVVFSGGVMNVGATGNGHAAIQFGTPFILGQEERLVFSFSLTTAASGVVPVTNSFRIGMLNTSTVLTNGTNPNLVGDGYAMFFNNLWGTGNLNSGQFLYDRTTTSGSLLTTSSPWGTIKVGTNNDIVDGGLSVSTTYQLTFTAQRNLDDTLTLTSVIDGGSMENATVSWVDTAGVFAFNTFALSATSTRPLMIDSVTISVVPIPEPSTYAIIFGALALGFAGWRRRNVR